MELIEKSHRRQLMDYFIEGKAVLRMDWPAMSQIVNRIGCVWFVL